MTASPEEVLRLVANADNWRVLRMWPEGTPCPLVWVGPEEVRELAQEALQNMNMNTKTEEEIGE